MKAAQNESLPIMNISMSLVILSAILIVQSSMQLKQKSLLTKKNYLVKTVSLYDNEMSFTAQLIRTLEYFSNIAKS